MQLYIYLNAFNRCTSVWCVAYYLLGNAFSCKYIKHAKNPFRMPNLRCYSDRI